MRRAPRLLAEWFLILLGLGTAATITVFLWILWGFGWWVLPLVLLAFLLLARIEGPAPRS